MVAVVGRPNVGKSTLFNRLVGAQVAVVHDVPGTTRDRIYGIVEWGGREFTLVDTGGVGLDARTEIERGVVEQAAVATREADLIVLVTDIRAGPTGSDAEVGQRLRRTDKPMILVANKGDSARDRAHAGELFELGLGEPIVISAHRGTGTGDLLDRIVELLPPDSGEELDEEEPLGVAIVGRPNVGKSSLLNAIVGTPRSIVSEVPGTTRDTIDTDIEYADYALRLIDTAGIRRRGHVEPGVETYSVLRAFRAIDRAEIAVVLIDAAEGVAAQDAHVAGYVHESAKGCIIAVNKWDLVTPDPEAGGEYLAMVRKGLSFLDYAPVVFISAKTGLHVNRILDQVLNVAEQRDQRVTTGQLNEFVKTATAQHPLTRGGRTLKILYCTQASVRPPTFVFFVNDVALVHFAYQRYLENQLRQRFGFDGTGIKLVFRRRGE